MYVFQPMALRDTGQANWLSRPPTLTEREENAIPLARISKERTSTGYRACKGVSPTEYTMPKRKIMAWGIISAYENNNRGLLTIDACAAAVLVASFA